MAKPAPAPEKKPDPQIASKEKKQAMLKKQVLMKKLQAVRAGAGSDITSSYKPDSKLTEGEDKVETPAGMGDITFDAGGAIPTTIKAIGDPRELETAMKLKKTQLRASGLNMSHEPEGDMVEAKVDKGMIFGKDAARNERRFGTKGKFDPQGSGPRGQDISQRAKLAVQRKKEHEARRGVKTKGVMEGDEMKPVEKTPEGMGDITFDAGGAIPTTIKAIGDPRELETAMKLKKTMLRASGLNMSHEPEGDMVEATKIDDKLRKDAQPIKGGGLYKSGMNKKVMGDRAVEARRNLNAAPKTGMYTDKFKARAERQKVHQAKRGVKKGMGEAYVVTQSDKTGNTKAYQDMKAGKKNQVTGEPLYKKADHLKENLVTISNINVKPSAYKGEKDLIKDILNK